MCIEIYSEQQKIEIPFELERIRFDSIQSFSGQYTILVRNMGDTEINHLLVLYPRPLFGNPKGGKVSLRNVLDVSEELPDSSPNSLEIVGDKLKMKVPNPNEPDKYIPHVEGRLDPENTSFSLPKGFAARHVKLLNNHGYSAWQVSLRDPIPPNEGHWFAWEIKVANAGESVQGSFGKRVYHTFASPVYVHRTVHECFSTAIDDCDVFTDEVNDLEYYRSFLTMLGMHQERRVDIKYYELTVEPGNPADIELMSWNVDGDLRMRSGSPRVQKLQDPLESKEWSEFAYEWKSGSMLEPPHPWQDLGFTLRFDLRTP